jgi:hypothetical protein
MVEPVSVVGNLPSLTVRAPKVRTAGLDFKRAPSPPP